MIGSLALGIFAIGLYGVLTRRDVVAVLASIEVMLAGALLLMLGLGAGSADPASVQASGLLVLVIVAAEAAVGLALAVAVARRVKTTRVDELTEVKG